MKGMIGKGSLRLVKGLLTTGLVASLCGLLSNNPESPHSAIPFAHLFSVPPVEASGTQPVDLSESAPIPLLNAWPEILDDPPAEPLIPPSLARKRTKERPLISIDRNHQADRVSTSGMPEDQPSAKIALTSLFTEAAPKPVSTSEVLPVADSQDISATHDPEEETPVEGEISAEEGEDVPFDEETPVYTEEELQQVQSEHSEPASAPAKKSGRKGYSIRVEGDDLVVLTLMGMRSTGKENQNPGPRPTFPGSRDPPVNWRVKSTNPAQPAKLRSSPRYLRLVESWSSMKSRRGRTPPSSPVSMPV